MTPGTKEDRGESRKGHNRKEEKTGDLFSERKNEIREKGKKKRVASV